MSRWTAWGAIVWVPFLVACGGGSDGERVGRLVGTPVGGLHYETEALTGTTTAGGEFGYLEGETITFFLGETSLGTVTAKPEISPFDLAGLEFNWRHGAIPSAFTFSYGPALNRILLFHALDEDRDPTNGLLVNDETAALFDDRRIDFLQSFKDFRNDFDFRVTVVDAVEQGSVSDIRIPALNSALQSFYDALPSRPTVFSVAESRLDADNDGIIDAVTSWVYDPMGNTTSQEITYSDPNEGDVANYYAYDPYGYAQGGTTEVAGVISSQRARTFDAMGNVVLEEEYAGSTLVRAVTYERDRLGYTSRMSVDTDGDGLTDRIYQYSRDLRGNVVREDYDSDGDGAVNRITTTQYDEFERVVREAVDQGGDGSINERRRIEHDDEAHTETEWTDSDGDGTDDNMLRTTRSANGALLLVEWDANADGNIDSTLGYEYDSEGRLIAETFQNDVNTRVTTYVRDARGNVVLEEHDSDGDGTPDRLTSTEYDDEDHRVRMTIDLGADGTADRVFAFEFDDAGNQTSWSIDQGGDGIIDSVTTSTYVETGVGRLVTELR